MTALTPERKEKKRRIGFRFMDNKIMANSLKFADQNDQNAHNIDTNLYSRQIGTFGLETMSHLLKLKILIIGLDGLGVECAKNLILAGPGTVCLYDDTIVRKEDLSANFYVCEADVGKNSRSVACVEKLQHLNPYVNVSTINEFKMECIKNFNVVVCTSGDLSFLQNVNEVCRNNFPPIGFICSRIFGFVGFAFVDFGPSFTCHDKDGEELKTAIINGITHEKDATVAIHTEGSMPFVTGDVVTFKEVEGAHELNYQKRVIKVTGNHTFTIGDTTMFDRYTREGIVCEVKVPREIKFKSLKMAMKNPISFDESCLSTPDMAKLDMPNKLHLACRAVLEYEYKYHNLPDICDEKAVAECFTFAKNFCAKLENEEDNELKIEDVDEKVISTVVRFSSFFFSPLAAFFGGIISQEVVKFTGKYTPLHQFLYFDCFELLPESIPSDNQSIGSIYDHQIAVWGKEFQETLEKSKIFVVGAGALGCEFLKNLALLGFCTDETSGRLTLTDMDQIEVSNLNRQFLFQREHVGAPKSITAAEAVKRINPKIQINALEERVGVESEEVFNDEFWETQDIIVNALDNVPSRQYVDSRCVWYRKPLIESGTLGTRANVQVIVPGITQSYNDSQDPPEQSIPLCTLKNFPNAIEHTIQWARDNFQGIFTSGPQECLNFLADPHDYIKKIKTDGVSLSLRRERLQSIYDFSLLCEDLSKIYENCIKRACRLFQDWFCNKILRLLHAFPPGHITASGSPFWSGPKRAPFALNFDIEDEVIFEFVKSTANIFAFNLGIVIPCEDDEFIKEIAAEVKLEEFVPIQMTYEENNGEETVVETVGDDETVCEALEKKLLAAENLSSVSIQIAEFEKDDDTNFHISFITSCANLRARNYRIAECDAHKAKMIAGKIIPAIATTTAMVSGLVCIEILKVFFYEIGKKKIENSLEKYKNSFVSLAEPIWLLSEPLPPVKTIAKSYDPVACGPVKAIPDGFTTWDRLELFLPNGTVRELINHLEDNYDVEVGIISVGNACLYNAYLPKHRKSRLDRPMHELAADISKKPLPSKRNYVVAEVSCNDKETMIDVILPPIRLQFA